MKDFQELHARDEFDEGLAVVIDSRVTHLSTHISLNLHDCEEHSSSFSMQETETREILSSTERILN